MKVFHCRCCGACCRWEGQVRYLPEEGRKIAEFLGISEEELIQRYTKLARDRRGLVHIPDREEPLPNTAGETPPVRFVSEGMECAG